MFSSPLPIKFSRLSYQEYNASMSISICYVLEKRCGFQIVHFCLQVRQKKGYVGRGAYLPGASLGFSQDGCTIFLDR